MKFTALFVASATVIDRLNNRSISRTKQLSNFTIYANGFNLKIRVWAFSDFGRKIKHFVSTVADLAVCIPNMNDLANKVPKYSNAIVSQPSKCQIFGRDVLSYTIVYVFK